MLTTYLTKNGYPMSIWIETVGVGGEKENWKGYNSTVTDKNGLIIASFDHIELRSRDFWATGFFAGREYVP